MKKYFLYPILSAILSLLLLEAILRLVGLGTGFARDVRNGFFSRKDFSVRIMTIGESTTADGGGGSGADVWPRQLEKILNDNGIKATVINEAHASTTSSHLVSRALDRLDSVNPDILISMMGINDSQSVRLMIRPEAGFWDLRLVHLGKRIVAGFKKAFSKSVAPEYFWQFPSTKPLIEELKSKPLEQVLAKIENESKDFDRIRRARYYAFLGYFSEPELVPTSDAFLNSFKLYQMSLNEYFEVEGVAERFLYMMNKVRDYGRCKEVLAKYIDRVGPLKDSMVMKGAHCRSAFPGDQELLKLLSQNTDGMSAADVENRVENTRKNYSELQKALREKKVALIAMQYPLKSVRELEDIFSTEPESEKPIFVSNESNFQEALTKHSEKEIFNDRFAGTFGHMTTLGHSFVALSSCNGVLKALKAQGRQDLPEGCVAK